MAVELHLFELSSQASEKSSHLIQPHLPPLPSAGDGNAKIFENDPRVTTFSMHGGAQAFPLRNQRSDYDVPLRPGVEDAEYLQTLSQYLPGLVRRHRPQLVFFQAGVDGLASDTLGTLSLTRAGLSSRNKMVYEACFGCFGSGTPLVITLGGGYSRPIDPSVDAVGDVALSHSSLLSRSLCCLSQCATDLSLPIVLTSFTILTLPSPRSDPHRPALISNLQHADVYRDAVRALANTKRKPLPSQ